ncbi:MAG: S8 family serine peptidase, partial [Lachnospiraceae bacterium]|nr:S8 family serine peptidase [Lachnospiraceae bacterium]
STASTDTASQTDTTLSSSETTVSSSAASESSASTNTVPSVEITTLYGKESNTSVPDVTEPAEIISDNASDYTGKKIILSFKKAISEKRFQAIMDQFPDFSTVSFDEDMALIQTRSSKALKEALELLPTIEEISVVQPDYSYSLADSEITGEDGMMDLTDEDSYYPVLPDDTYFTKQWGLYNDGGTAISTASQRQAQAGVDINILEAWTSFQSSKEVIVAVVDTGVDYKHSDLKQNIYINSAELNGTKGVDDDGNGYVDDIYGWDFYNNDASVCHYDTSGKAYDGDDDNHGTHCAGIIAASTGNGIGISGVASNINIKILPVKALGGSDGTSNSYTLAQSIRYAAARGAKICNASWTTYDNDAVLKNAILESNMLFICASGNNMTSGGDNLDSKSCYPASFHLANTITVGAIDSDGRLSYYSNYGSKTVSLAAPGTRIVSTIVGAYAYMSGTSMAAPFVTGVAAMIYAKNSQLYPSDLVKILAGSVTSLSNLNGKVSSGGMINASAALKNTDSYVQTKDTTPPSISVKVTPYQKYATATISVKDTGSTYLVLSRYAKGKKSASYFKNGQNGTTFGTTLKLKSAGDYTFYAMDAAGNTKIKYVKITFDTKSPSVSLKVKKKKKRYQVTIKAKDSQSGMKYVRYLTGRKKASQFKNGKKGKKITLKSSKSVLTLKKKGTYSFYFRDKAGNSIVKVLKIK